VRVRRRVVGGFDLSLQHSQTSECVAQGLLLFVCPAVVHLQFMKAGINRGLRGLSVLLHLARLVSTMAISYSCSQSSLWPAVCPHGITVGLFC
jgi:hypothetical protein